jgi:uncharacterized protein (TIGR02453 family)
MTNVQILPESFGFLKTLEANNNRDWFAANKDAYLTAQNNIAACVDHLILLMNDHDHLENKSGKKSLYRIYNDVRFSKDKTPYGARFAFSLRRATPYKRGGYYTHLKPGSSYLACGFFAPNPADLKRIRTDIVYNHQDWRKILDSKLFKKNFDVLLGNLVPTVPRGFDKEHIAIDLIRHKQFILKHTFTDEEVLNPNFLFNANEIFKSVRPFFDYLSMVLTTDANGEMII